MSESAIRWLIYKNPEGLEDCLIRNGSCIYIDELQFFKFLKNNPKKKVAESHNHSAVEKPMETPE